MYIIGIATVYRESAFVVEHAQRRTQKSLELLHEQWVKNVWFKLAVAQIG